MDAKIGDIFPEGRKQPWHRTQKGTNLDNPTPAALYSPHWKRKQDSFPIKEVILSMKITVPQLQSLASNLQVIALFTQLTKTKVDDDLVAMLQRVAEDEQALEMIVRFLNWIPLFGSAQNEAGQLEPELRKDIEPYRGLLEDLRANMAT